MIPQHDLTVQTLLVGGLISVANAVIALYLWNERRKEIFLLFWSLAWTCNALRWGTLYVALYEPVLRSFLSFESAVVHFLVTLGCFDLLPGKRWRRTWMVVLTAIVAVGFTVAGLVFQIPAEMEYARAFTMLGFWAASMLVAFRFERLPGYAIAAVTIAAWAAYVGVALAVLGAGTANHIVIPLFNVPLAFSIIVIAYQRSRRELAESEERRRSAEKELQRQRDELAHAQRVATLGELTASITHELAQPLTAILADARAAVRFSETDPKNGEVKEALLDIAAAAGAAGETIHRLRAMFKKQGGESTLLDVNILLQEVLRLLKNDLLQSHIQVHFLRQENLPPVLGDPVQLRQVMLNVLVNAKEAIAAAEAGPREIQIETRRDERGCVAIDIRDSGVGLPETELQRMFHRFVTSKPQGLGMGLAISRSIVQAHQGRIWASRNAGYGLTLHIRLAAAEALSAEADRGQGRQDEPRSI
jgi:signal transduction histidine kinase